jgi:hypothetical protein
MKKLIAIAALLSMSALMPTTALAATGLAIVCPDSTQEGLVVSASCGAPTTQASQIYKTPLPNELIRVDPTAVEGGSADWSATNLDYTWMKWSNVPVGMLYETCKTDIPDPTTVGPNGNLVCNAWAFVKKAGAIPFNSALLSWTPATQNDDGSAYTNPKGYFIYSGVVNPPATKSALITPATVISKQFDNLATGTWFFQITSVNSADIESAKSAVGQKVVVAAVPKPTVTMSVTPRDGLSSVTPTIAWGSTNATGCVASGGWTGAKAVSGSATQAKVTVNTTYTLTCTGPGGTTAISSDVTVSPRPNAPAVTVQ